MISQTKRIEDIKNVKSEEKNNGENTKSFINSFDLFNSSLFISKVSEDDKQIEIKTPISFSLKNETENTLDLEEEDNNSIKFDINQESLDFILSCEKCITHDLLNALTKSSQETNKNKIFKNEEEKMSLKVTDNYSNNNKENIKDFPKITNNFFSEKGNKFNVDRENFVEDKNTRKKFIKKNKSENIFEDSVNGFQYELKYITSSVNNLIPKTHKKNKFGSYSKNTSNFIYNSYQKNKTCKASPFILNNKHYYNSFYYYNNQNKINSFYYNENSNSNYYYSQNINSSIINIKKQVTQNIFINKRKNETKKQKEKKEYDWLCDNCFYLNKNYHKNCINCKSPRNSSSKDYYY